MRRSLQLLALALGVLLLIGLPSREARAADPNAEAIANGLQDFAAFGDTIGEFEELGESLPFTDLTPGSADGLRLSDLFGDTFAALPGTATGSLTALESALEDDLDGTYGGVDVDVSDVTISEDTPTTGQIEVVLTFTATRTVTPPLAFEHEIIDLDGGSISIDLTLSTTDITFRLDTSLLATPELAFAIVGEPTIEVDVDATGAIGALTANLGFAEVDVSGTAALDLDVDIDLADPDDDGLITDDEFTSTALVDLVDVAFVDDGGTHAVDVELDFDTSLVSASTPAECSSGDACLILLDPDITNGLNAPDFHLGDLEDFRNFTAAEALLAVDRLVDWLTGLQATGQLDVSLPFVGGTFSDVLQVAEELQAAAASLRNNAEENIPTFDDAEELGEQLGAALGVGTIVPTFSTASPGVLKYDIDISDSASDSVPLNFGGSLDVLSRIEIDSGGTATLEGAYSLDLTFGLDLSEQPQEGGAGIGTCQDEEDNDDDALIDAEDPDCADLKTIGQRAFLDVGTSGGSPELAVRIGLSATNVDANARIGMLEAGIEDASLRIGSNEDEDDTATAGTCNDGVDNDSDGADVDDDDCAFISVDFTKTGDGRLTIEDLFDTLGGRPPDGASLAAHLSANLDATVPVEATLGGAPLVGGDILVTGEFDGPLTSAADFVSSIEVDASDLAAGDLLNFSPCSNDTDDDGDLAVNDGCPQVGAAAESDAECENAADDDSDGVVNDGCPAVADPETESQALLDQIIALIQALADEFDLLEQADVGSSLSDPLPLLGTSFENLLSFADSLETLLDDMTAVGEDPATECGNNIDDDHDGFVNDGCPTVDGVPEAGPQCDDGEPAGDDEDNDASSAAQDADGFFNDGCPPANPSLQALEEQIEGLLEDALNDLVATDTNTTSVTPTVDVQLSLDGSDLKFLTDVDVTLDHSSTFNLDLSDLDPSLEGVDIVALDTTDDLNVEVVAHLDLDFGMDLDDYSFFVLGSTGLNITAEADADDIVFDVGIGPLTARIGTDTPVAEIDADATACDPGNTDDEDEDGVVNDGCAADNDDESDGCGNAFDGDEDGKINDGCPAEGSANDESGAQCDNAIDDHASGSKVNDGCPEVDGSSESGTECDNDTDDDDDGAVNDGCPADGDAEGADEPAVCENDTNDDSNDDADNSINDGCPAVADKGRAHVGAEFDIDLVGGPTDQVAPGSLDFSGGTGFDGIVQPECEDFVSPGSKHACAILPLYFEDAPLGTPPDHHITMALPDITDLSTIEFAYPGVSELVDAIGDQIIDLLLMNSGLGRFLEILDSLLNGEILGFELPLIGDALDQVSGFIETLEGSSPGFGTNLSDAINSNLLDSAVTASDVESAAQALASELGETLDGDDGGDLPILLDTNGDTTIDETDVMAEVFCDDATCVSPETGTDCDNAADDDGDGVVNDGCPVAGNSAESGADCDNSDDDDGPGGDSSDVGELTAKVNDGCYPGGFDPYAWNVTEVRFRAKLGQSAALVDLSADFNLDGIPGLGLSSEGNVTVDAFWSLDIGFGVNKTDGFFLLTNDADGSPETDADCEDNYSDDDSDGVPNDGCPELTVGADVRLQDSLNAVLGFLEIKVVNGDPSDLCASVGSGTATPCRPAGDAVDPASSFDPKFIIDLKDPGSTPDGRFTFAEMTSAPSFKKVISYDFVAEADVNLHIETSIAGEAALPKLIGDLFIDWRWSLQGKDDADELEADSILDNPCITPADTNCFSIKIDNLVVDAGTFLSKFLGPMLFDAQRFTEPLQPVIDVLNEPIPVLTEMSGEPVTLLTLVEDFGPSDNNLDMIIAIVKAIDFINGIQAPTGNENLTIPIGDGSFDLDAATLQKGPLGSDSSKAFKSGQLTGLSSLMGQFDAKNGDFSDSDVRDSGELKDDIGLSFPFLEEPSQLLLMMFGQDADLILWEPPDLEAGFSYSQRFGPIWSLPPVFIEIGGSVTITGHLAIGYDTQGLREVLSEGAGGASLLHGLFLGDLKDGVDVPEFALRGELRIGATVSVLIFSAGAFGGVGLTLELDLEDPNADGKLKFQEVSDILLATANPFCLFIFSGQFDVFLGVFVEVDLFFWSLRWETILAQIVLLRFSVQCDFNVTPVLAHVDGSDNLVLHAGPNSGLRGANSVGINATAEDFQVIQEPNGDLTVRAFGFSETHPKPGGGWSRVIADMSHAVGDPKDDEDVLTLLDGALGGETGAECANALDDDGDGFVNDGCPGQGKIERVDECADALDDDDDGFVNDGCPPQGDLTTVPFTVPAVINGGMGDDQLTGGNGGDYINGGSQNDLINARGGNDNVEGGPGNDQIGGASGDDYIFGDNATVGAAETGADCDGDDDDADDVVDDGCFDRTSSEPCDTDLEAGGDGNDTVEAGLGEDIVCGQGGDDTITGGISNAKAVGAAETGAQCGNNVDDDGDDAIDDGCEDAADKLFGGSGTDTINGGDGGDFIYGEDDPDNINGDKGNDVIYGGDESSPGDTIFGGPGADEIHGGDGDDRIIGGNIIAGEPDVGDTLLAGDGGDDIILGDNAEFTSDTEFTLIDPNIGGGDVINGGSGSDVIRGQKGDDDIFGGDGNDNIQGNAGEDFIFGDNGTINNRATASVTVSEAGGDGVDTMNGNEDDDHMYGGGAGDFMYGDAGTDYMEGNSGGDTMRGGQQDDEMHGDHADDNSTAASPGKDTMFGDSGADDMFGGPDQDNMRGGIGDDYMEGNGDADLMHGDAHQDDMIGGTSKANKEDEEFDFGGLIGVRGDLMFGDASQDVMVGDNGTITRPAASPEPDGTKVRTVVLFDLECNVDNEAGPDLMFGNFGNDDMYGGGESDTMHGNAGDDYMEGNCDGDLMWGDADQDDMIGGTSQEGGDTPDGVDTMYGDDGDTDSTTGGDAADVMAGDNAGIDRPTASPWIDDPDTGDVVRETTLFDVKIVAGPVVLGGTSAGDIMYGEGDHDEMFGQGGNDEMHGGDDFDYMEGNHDDDEMWGDAGQDDMVGGGSADDGVVRITDNTRIGDDLLDGDDTMYGDDGDLDSATGGDDNDVMAGDNALVVRPSPWQDDINTGGVVRELRLFDVELSGGSVGPGTSGGDIMYGEGGDDVMFGQGGNDTMSGGDAFDYMEGNHDDDTMSGDAGQDDMIGGGSANDGEIDSDSVGDDLLDGDDTMYGEDSASGEGTEPDGDNADVMLGDNGVITRPTSSLWIHNTFNEAIRRLVVLADVEVVGDPQPDGEAGEDKMWGNDSDDIMYGQGDEDEMHGGRGDDYMEGNADSDLMFGGEEEDDMLGGTGPTTSSSQLHELSASDAATVIPGRTDKSTTTRDGVPFGTGTTGDLMPTIDDVPLGDEMYGGPAADTMLGDNGSVERPLVGGLWDALNYDLQADNDGSLESRHPTGGPSGRVNRNTSMLDTTPGMTAGSDLMFGEDGDDDMYGQYDDTGASGIGDEMYGADGEDAMAGDQGVFDSRLLTDASQHIEPKEPFIDDDIFIQGTLYREFQFPLANQAQQIATGGADRMRGGANGDWMHGGAGSDIMNGDEGNDRMFGDNGDDHIWGGHQHDHIWGGYGFDFLDVHPRVDESEAAPDSCNPLDPPDPSVWYAFAFDSGGTCDGNLEDVDYMYGGWDADALQANVGDNGPRIGDRLIDSAGVYNLYILCPATYGEFVSTRESSPAMTEFIHQLAEGDGAFEPGPEGKKLPPSDPSGFNEIAFVYKKYIKHNVKPPYAGTPAHFTIIPDCQTID